MVDLQGRVALVTGASRGIGRAIALALAERGSAVAVNFQTRSGDADAVVAEIRSAGGRAIAIRADVSIGAQVAKLVARAVGELGPVDVLVNNAGIAISGVREEDFDRGIAINLKSAFLCTEAVLPAMTARRWGRIVNISSDAGRVGSSLESVYAGAKGAIISFTKTIARETARLGVTANIVCPGPTNTEMLQDVAAAHPDADKVLERLARAVPMKRLGQPTDVAWAVRFFASEQASYITGQTLSVSGGLTMA